MYNKPLVCQNLKPKNKNPVNNFAHTPLTVAILLACSFLNSVPLAATIEPPIPTGEEETLPPGPASKPTYQGATLTVKGENANVAVIPTGMKNPTRGNGLPHIFLTEENRDASSYALTVKVEGGDYTTGNYQYQTYILGNYLSYFAEDSQKDKLNGGTVSFPETTPGQNFYYSSNPNDSTVRLVFGENASFYSVVYGGRNDIASTDSKDTTIGQSLNNAVEIDLTAKGSQWRGTLIFGGRSAQAEGANNVLTGYATDFNRVIITGRLTGFTENVTDVSMKFAGGGIFGAEGWQANNNLILLDGVAIQSTNDKTRKLGIVGGRALFDRRVYAPGTLEYEQDKNTRSDSNVVLIKNSNIGYIDQKVDENDYRPMAIFGGYSYGFASNNIVSIEDSVINGNVIGGLEMQGVQKVSGTENLRDLHANLVSLHNVTLKGKSNIYGTATAEETPQAKDEDDRVDEENIYLVNRRRGVGYFAGHVEAQSAYLRYVHFGQYYDQKTLQEKYKNSINLGEDYVRYTDENGMSSLKSPSLNKPGVIYTSQEDINTIGKDSDEGIRLGQLVAGSYLVNTSGFHSSLASSDEKGQSPVTKYKHNFWVATYTVLGDTVDGDGTYVGYERSEIQNHLFKSGTDVNHYYGTDGKEGLSLLVQDNGVVFNRPKESVTWPDAFRDNYKDVNGTILYLAVNNGTDADGNSVQAIKVSRPAIEVFRDEADQKTNAYGNTQVFVGKVGDATYTTKAPMGHLDQPSENYEDFVFSIDGFAINQGGEKVATARYGFYKYLHFDGTFDKDAEVYVQHVKDADGNNVAGSFTHDGYDNVTIVKGETSTAEGEAGGVGLKYWLESLSIEPGKTLTLYGLPEGETANIANYTLSAEISGPGNIAIPAKTSVILGDVNNRKTKGVNSFTGGTTVAADGSLILGSDGALGSENTHTAFVHLTKATSTTAPTSLFLQGHVQTIGALEIEEGAVLSFSEKAAVGTTESISKDKKGELTVLGGANVAGSLKGEGESLINIVGNYIDISSANLEFTGTVYLKSSAKGLLNNAEALQNATANVAKGSQLFFLTAPSQVTTRSVGNGSATIGSIVNSGEVFLSNENLGPKTDSLNVVDVQKNYAGTSGSVIHYRGLVQGPNNSQVDVIHSQTATGTSEITFGNHKDLPPVGVFAQSQGEKTLKENGIPVFIVQNPTHNADDLVLTMDEFGVKAKDNEAYKWMYGLGYNEKEDGSREWVLYNSNTPDDEPIPIIPPSPSVDPDLPNVPVLRPESGAYIANSEAWAKMHMRLHDRFGQAYYIDPFDGEEKKASGWVRQVGTHSHFKAGSSKTHARTAITQVGADLIRNEANEDWKYVGGVFAGGLYNRANTRSWDSAKSRSDGYSLGIYGTIYTGNSPDDGFYVDSWLLFGRYDNKVWGDENPGFKYKSRGWVWSVESGYTIPLSESGTKDYNKLIWTFQPEVQVVWDGVRASSVVDNTGTKYTQLGKDNVSIRVGARLHANYMNKGLGFIEGNWIHNTKSPGVRMTNGDIYRNGGRNVGEFRMGLEGHLSRNTLGWATVGVQAGKSGYHNETAQIGLRYMF